MSPPHTLYQPQWALSFLPFNRYVCIQPRILRDAIDGKLEFSSLHPSALRWTVTETFWPPRVSVSRGRQTPQKKTLKMEGHSVLPPELCKRNELPPCHCPPRLGSAMTHLRPSTPWLQGHPSEEDREGSGGEGRPAKPRSSPGIWSAAVQRGPRVGAV